jgi:hypothetical protein
MVALPDSLRIGFASHAPATISPAVGAGPGILLLVFPNRIFISASNWQLINDVLANCQ